MDRQSTFVDTKKKENRGNRFSNSKRKVFDVPHNLTSTPFNMSRKIKGK